MASRSGSHSPLPAPALSGSLDTDNERDTHQLSSDEATLQRMEAVGNKSTPTPRSPHSAVAQAATPSIPADRKRPRSESQRAPRKRVKVKQLCVVVHAATDLPFLSLTGARR